MELDGRNGHIKTSLEVAMERFDSIPAVEPPHNGPQPVQQPARGAETYDESIFAKTDHVSTQSKTFRTDKKSFSYEPIVTDDESKPEDFSNLVEMPVLHHPPAEDVDVAVHWGGPMFDYGGYARMNRTYTIALKQMGALVKTRPVESITNVNEKTEGFIRKLSEINVPKKYPRVYGMTIPDVIAHSGRKILYTMMETSNKIHPELAERYNMADEIWVPCEWNKEVFKASGVLPEIRVMPLGVDTSLFKPGYEPLPMKAATFRFISVFGWSFRKGFDVLLQAYLEEFSSSDDVSLILSSKFVGQVEKKNRIFTDFEYIKTLVEKPASDLPHVMLHSAYTPDKDMPRLYCSGDCFVLPSRGEGWGLPYMEAGSCGVPVIASDHGGQRDFLDDEVAYLVPPDGYFVSKRQDPQFRNMAWISHFYEDQEFPHFGRPALDLLKKHMRHVYENREEARKKGAKLRDRIVNKFDWKFGIQRVYNRLREICAEIPK